MSIAIRRPAACAALAMTFLLIASACAPLAQTRVEQRVTLVMRDGPAPPVNEWDLHLSFGVIAGAFTGTPLARNVILIPVAFDREFAIPMAPVQRTVAPYAQPLTAAQAAVGTVVTPAQTRFLRLSAFIADKKTGNSVMGGGFGEKLGARAMLTYFDRPCTLRERTMEGDDLVDVSVDIPAEGMYWVRSDEVSPNVFHLRTATSAMALRFEAGLLK
jgi:hypothetical protein